MGHRTKSLAREPLRDKAFIEGLFAAHAEGRLIFLGEHASLANARAFEAFLKPLRGSE